MPREVLAEIHSLQQQLERAIVANERIRRQLERELPPPGADELVRKLEVSRDGVFVVSLGRVQNYSLWIQRHLILIGIYHMVIGVCDTRLL